MTEIPCGDPPVPGTMAMTFEAPPYEAVAIQLDAAALARQKRQARLADAKAYEQLDQRLLKFKARKFGEVGEYIVTALGVKKVGHGTIISASENADQYIQKCDALVKELLSKDPPVDPEVIVELMRLAMNFNQQLLDSGEAHLRIDRQPSSTTEEKGLSIPFPQGTPMLISVNHPQPKAQASIEDSAPET